MRTVSVEEAWNGNRYKTTTVCQKNLMAIELSIAINFFRIYLVRRGGLEPPRPFER